MSDNAVFPGDKIASIEEYEAGNNTFDDGDMVRAATVGERNMDKETRIADVKHPKALSVPNVGDVIIGTVAAVMSSMIAVTIEYINGNSTTSKVECICGTRNMRIRNVALVNDMACLKIVAHLNGTIHAVMNEPELGIIFTKCRKCGGKVVAKSSDAIKCTDCGWIDERKLSSNFGKSNFIKLRE